jgi:Rhodopirellula transposase DDE domain
LPKDDGSWSKTSLTTGFANQEAAGLLWKKKDPDILPALEQLLQEYTAGDPCSNKKWQRQSLQQLKEKLHAKHPVSAPTVARLLRALDYSPKVNRKLLGTSHPHRDEQFGYIEGQKRLFLRRGWPVISVDAKKRELIGWFKNAGEAWCRESYLVNAYDYPSLAEGVGIPYGLYDPARNEGFVYVGTSSNTAEFAVDAIQWWWLTYGKRRYSGAPALLILADGGGSNGHRVRLWKYTLQHRLVDPMSSQVTVCHYPTGASKWNPVEHRLFGPISTNWKGYPLFSYERMLSCIRGTTTEKGLRVRATIDWRMYATKKKVSDAQMMQVNLHKHKVFPNWNYTIKPSVAW